MLVFGSAASFREVMCSYIFFQLQWRAKRVKPGAYERSSVSAHQEITAAVQITPTVDLTVTALEKEQLNQQVNKLKTDNSWEVWTFLAPFLTVLLGVLAGVGSFWRWRRDRLDEQKRRAEDQRIEQKKRAEERFQAAVAALGNQEMRTSVGAAITLRTFLHSDYNEFHAQVFDLAVAYLRFRKADPNIPEPLNSLDQALISVFKESFPLVRAWKRTAKGPNLKEQNSQERIWRE